MAAKTLIVSDLHLGNGQGYDIFAGADALPEFLLRFAEPGNCVIINGDSVDFLMNEEPLELTEERALAQADKCFSAPATAAVLRALGKVLAAGGEVVVRLGNHDIELALTKVQARMRAALGQPDAVAARLRFERGEQPAVLTIGGVRILVTHGEHGDPWNRVDYPNLPGGETQPGGESKGFVYGPGSRLVKTLMNPLKRVYGLRFADLMKPDLQGGVMTALAVNPRAVKMVFQGSTLTLMWQLFQKMSGPSSFAPDEDQAEPNLGLAAAVNDAGLSPEERAALENLLDPDAGVSFGADDDTVLDSARKKLAMAGLKLYAHAQRTLTADSGQRYFALAPDAQEWTEAERLAHKYNTRAVIFGHTHAARWQATPELVFINTGTWIWLMKLPAPDASTDEWTQFLELARSNPRLDPAVGPSVPLFSRFTAAVIEPHPERGAVLSLIEWKLPGEIQTLGQQHLLP